MPYKNPKARKALARKRRKSNLCACGQDNRPGFKTCEHCKKRNSKQRADYLASGRCYCSRKCDVPGSPRCSVCRQQSRLINRRLKLEVITAYGGKCACPGGCSITNPDWLSVDHIKGGGVQQRRKLRLIGMDFYRWLKKHKFPKEDYRLLCYNCNLSRGHLGRCPHEVGEKN